MIRASRFEGGRKRRESPCEDYAGNLCSGFGAETICWTCGWDRFEHYRIEKVDYAKERETESGDDN